MRGEPFLYIEWFSRYENPFWIENLTQNFFAFLIPHIQTPFPKFNISSPFSKSILSVPSIETINFEIQWSCKALFLCKRKKVLSHVVYSKWICPRQKKVLVLLYSWVKKSLSRCLRKYFKFSIKNQVIHQEWPCTVKFISLVILENTDHLYPIFLSF